MKTSIQTPFDTISEEALRLQDEGLSVTEILGRFPAWQTELSELFENQHLITKSYQTTPEPSLDLTKNILQKISVTPNQNLRYIEQKEHFGRFNLLNKVSNLLSHIKIINIIAPLLIAFVVILILTRQDKLWQSMTNNRTEQIVKNNDDILSLLDNTTEEEETIAEQSNDEIELVSSEEQTINSFQQNNADQF